MFCHHPPRGGAVPLAALTVAGAVFAHLLLPAHSFAQKAVAVVNSVSITQEQYERSWPVFLREKGIPPEDPGAAGDLADLRKELLDDLVNRELLYQEAVREGYGVDAARVREEYARVCRPFRSEAEIREALGRSGYSAESYMEYLHRRLTVEAYLKDRVASAVRVEPGEVSAVLRERPDAGRSPEKVALSHILFRVPLGAGEGLRAAARQKAEEVARQIAAGGDFDELARRHSDCPSAKKGGDLGLFPGNAIPPPFEEAVLGLQPGEVSEVVETSFGFHLVRLDRRLEAREASPDELEGQARSLIREEKVRSALQDLVGELRSRASVDISLEN